MVLTAEKQKEIVSNLCISLRNAQQQVITIKNTIQEEVLILQKLCQHIETYNEDSGDYHKPKFYTVCKYCAKHL